MSIFEEEGIAGDIGPVGPAGEPAPSGVLEPLEVPTTPESNESEQELRERVLRLEGELKAVKELYTLSFKGAADTPPAGTDYKELLIKEFNREK